MLLLNCVSFVFTSFAKLKVAISNYVIARNEAIANYTERFA